jgi:anthranilate synthase/aminodeoxychorismate synthase-like glutamine amidotransferase
MHIVSQVSGKLRPECSPVDAFRSVFPAGTVSGAPKVQAMELVASLEKERRGIYAGAVGYFSFDSNIDTCISIRTALYHNGKYYFQAGGGIVYDSDPAFENEETYHKMAALARSLEIAEKSVFIDQVVNLSSLNLEVSENSLLSLFRSLPQVSGTTNDKSAIIHPVKKENTTTSLLIDNYDSFTWNLYQYLSKLGENVIVYRHDKISVSEALALNPDHIIISPGPGWPKDAGVSNDIIKEFFGKKPILGVCLGHECLTDLFGGEILHCGEVKHGKTSRITHDGKGIYQDLPNEIEVIRYHSLAASIHKIPPDFYVTSRTESGVIMGIRHNKYRVEGVQFHPESIKTDHGIEMLKTFLSWDKPEW